MLHRSRRISNLIWVIPFLLTLGCEDKGSYVYYPDVIPPDRIDTLEAVASADSTVTLTWQAPGDDPRSGIAHRYEIRYQKRQMIHPWWESATTIVKMKSTAPYVGMVESTTISGLLPAEKYFFAIKAADEVPNWSEMSNVVEVLVTPLDVSGTWRGIIHDVYDIWPSSATFSLDLNQSGYAVTGTYAIATLEGSLYSGLFHGTQFDFIIRFESWDVDYIFSADLEGNRLDGAWWQQVISTGKIYGPRYWYVERTN